MDLFICCRHFTSEDPAPALPSSLLRPSSRSNTDADVSTSLKPSSIRLFPCSSDTGPSSPWLILALRPRSTRLLQSYSRQRKSARSYLNMRSLLSWPDVGPYSGPALLKVLEDETEGEMVRHGAAEAHGGSVTDSVLPVLRKWALKTTHPGRSGKAVWWRLTGGRYVVLLTSGWAHLH